MLGLGGAGVEGGRGGCGLWEVQSAMGPGEVEN